MDVYRVTWPTGDGHSERPYRTRTTDCADEETAEMVKEALRAKWPAATWFTVDGDAPNNPKETP